MTLAQTAFLDAADSALPLSQLTGGLDSVLAQARVALSGERALEAGGLAERWRRRRFVVLVAGEFKRGKSTLLNALVGADVLPTGVLPVTSVPTRVMAGPQSAARVTFDDGREREIALVDVRDYVDESRNPGNRLGVASVDVELPVNLPPGVVLVDVPGLGSVHRHNSASALSVLPEADAVLVVVSVDPPIGRAELRLLERLRRHVARLDVVLNKIDYLDEPARRDAEVFTRDVLVRHGFEAVSVWPVSARAGLRTRLSGDDVGWRRSGLEALEDSLRRFLSEERERLLAHSLARKTGRLVEQEIALLDLQMAASRRSSAELHGLVGAFSEQQVTAQRDASEAVLIFGRRFEALFAGYAERAATAWDARRVTLEVRLAAIVRRAGGESRTAVRKELRTAGSASVEGFLDGFLADESIRLHGDYERLRGEVVMAAAQRAAGVWRMAAEFLSFDPPRVDASSLSPVAQPAGLQLEEPRLMLEDLEDAFASFLPRQMALRRLAARELAEADDRQGRAVEQTRDHFIRAYEADFRSLIGRFQKAGAETASAIAAVLRAAQSKVEQSDAGASSATAEGLRRETLGDLLAALRGIGGEA